jgi:hypothetical protein
MKTSVDYDEFLGVVKYQGEFRYLIDMVAWWIMDYATYDPRILTAAHRDEFRGGVTVVDNDTAEDFLRALADQEITREDLKKLLAEKKDPEDEVRLTFLIDFDQRLYVSMFFDIGLEDYVPKGWKGIYDDPLKYIPDSEFNMFAAEKEA